MPDDRRLQLGSFLSHLVESLDISDTQREEAVKHYEAVGNWLKAQDSPIAMYGPQIYPQGSFRLGTMIKPINDNDQYDIDLVCELKMLAKDRLTQKQLKDMVGDRLKQHKTYSQLLDREEGRRCWKLNYADSARFHMDILPCVPDSQGMNILLENAGFSGSYWTESAIAITDKTLPNYSTPDVDWPKSNPVGYCEWFKDRMSQQYFTTRQFLAESMCARIEDVPEYKVKTPLQRAIQILKRHRDIMFADDKDNRPTSIIISTLAAWSYNNEGDLMDALQKIVIRMPRYIESREGSSWVPNPVNPMENYADRWREHPQRESNFRKWLQQIQVDFNVALQSKSLHEMTESLKPRFGDRIINETAKKVFSDTLISASKVASVPPIIHISQPSEPWGV